MIEQLRSMSSGECRWVGDEGIHVYCWAPCDLVKMPDGRERFLRREPLYKVWTADSIGTVWDAAGWRSAAAVVKQIKDALAAKAA